jgi:hypothetical protein
MPTARIDMVKGKSADYRAKMAHLSRIVEVLEAPEDNYMRGA